MTSTEIRRLLEESESEEEPYLASDEDEYIPDADIESEQSDAEKEYILEQEEEYDSDENNEEEQVHSDAEDLIAKDGTRWYNASLPQTQTLTRNILRQRRGVPSHSNLFTAKDMFKSMMIK